MRTLLLASLFLSTAVFGQHTNFSPHLRLGVFIDPELTDLADLGGSFARWGGFRFQHKYGYTSGLQIELAVVKEMYLRTGFVYGQRSYEMVIDNVAFPGGFDPATGRFRTATLHQKVQYRELHIPAVLRLNGRIKERSALFIKIGGGFGLQLSPEFKNIFIADDNGEEIELTEDQVPLGWGAQPNLFFLLGVGYESKVTPYSYLTIEPETKFYVQDYINRDRQLYTFGLRFCYAMNFFTKDQALPNSPNP